MLDLCKAVSAFPEPLMDLWCLPSNWVQLRLASFIVLNT